MPKLLLLERVIFVFSSPSFFSLSSISTDFFSLSREIQLERIEERGDDEKRVEDEENGDEEAEEGGEDESETSDFESRRSVLEASEGLGRGILGIGQSSMFGNTINSINSDLILLTMMSANLGRF